MARRQSIAIEIGRRRLRALLAVRSGDGLKVKRVLVADVPGTVDFDDVDAAGQWIRQQLDEAEFPRGRATIAMAREHVGLKRFHLPTTDADELPGMTRMALPRELAVEVEDAVIDFIPVARTETGTTVMAVAVPGERLETTRKIVEAAGLTVHRISLRAMGMAALLNTLGRKFGHCVLAVDVTGDGAEFCVVEDGHIRFSRAAEVPYVESSKTIAESVITETRRSWMSYRIVEDASEVQHAVVTGDRRVAEQSARPIGEMLKADAVLLDDHPLVKSNGETLDRVWPLAGLLLEPIIGVEAIDFSNPRKAVDKAAALRRKVIYAAAIIVTLIMALWTVGNRNIQSLQTQRDDLASQRKELYPDYLRHIRDTFTQRHVHQWESVHVNWLDHLEYLHGMMPPDTVILDSWVGSLEFRGVKYDEDRQDTPWYAPREITIRVDGEADNRATADALRAVLVRDATYTASSAGSDSPGGKRLPFGFTYILRTQNTDSPNENAISQAGEEGGTP